MTASGRKQTLKTVDFEHSEQPLSGIDKKVTEFTLMSLTKLGPSAKWFRQEYRKATLIGFLIALGFFLLASFGCDLLEMAGVVDVFGCPTRPQAP